MEEKKLPVYESPKVVTYTDEELLEELGPAQTGYVKGDSAFQRKQCDEARHTTARQRKGDSAFQWLVKIILKRLVNYCQPAFFFG